MIRVKLAILGLGLLSVLGLVGCRGSEAGGTPPPVVEPDEPVSHRVGPEGGTVETSGGAVTLVIPAGALNEEVTIAIEPDADAAHPWAVPGTAYRFSPEGLTFAESARLSLRYDPAATPASDPVRGLALYRVDEGEWLELDSVVDPETHTVSAEIGSFSRYGIGAVAPRLDMQVGVMQRGALIPVAMASLETNACQNVACTNVEEELHVLDADLALPTFTASEDGCGFYSGWSARLFNAPDATRHVTGLNELSFGQAIIRSDGAGAASVLEFDINTSAQPWYVTGHNTTTTVVSQASFFRLDELGPMSRRLVLDIDNPGGVTFDLAIGWVLEGRALGIFAPHVQAAAEVALLGCGDRWEDAQIIALFNEIAGSGPGMEIDLDEVDASRLRGLSAPRLQLWIGLDLFARARSFHGDEEGTVGYGRIEGGQAGIRGVLAFDAQMPQE